MATTDTDAVQVPRWAFRVAGGTILLGLTAFFTTAIFLVAWLMLLTIGIASFSNESRTDRKKLHIEIEQLGQQARDIQKATKAVEQTVVPEGRVP
jgi:hypothetical protein